MKTLVLFLVAAMSLAGNMLAQDGSSAATPSLITLTSIDFGLHYQNENPVAKTSTLTNGSGSTITITNITTEIGDVFYVTGTTCGSTLNAGANCSITVDFAPAVANVGGNNDVLEVFDSAGQQNAPLVGRMRCPVGGCQ